MDGEYELLVPGTASRARGAQLILPGFSGYIRQSWSNEAEPFSGVFQPKCQRNQANVRRSGTQYLQRPEYADRKMEAVIVSGAAGRCCRGDRGDALFFRLAAPVLIREDGQSRVRWTVCPRAA